MDASIGCLQIRPLVSVALCLEYESVPKRPEQQAAHGMSEAGVDRALAGFLSLAEAVDVHFRWRPQLTDPKDEMVLEAAVNGRADALVTHNIRDFEKIEMRFGLHVLRPRDCLEQIST